jgi:hypothetical protein
VPSRKSPCSIKRAHEVDLGISLKLGGMTLWCQKDSGSVVEICLLAETLTGCQKVYQVLDRPFYCQTDQ